MADLHDPFEKTALSGNREAPLPHSWRSTSGQSEERGWWLLIFAAAILLACLFMVGVVLNGMQSFRGENARQEEAEEMIDRFMTFLEKHQEEEAYGLFSRDAQQETSLEALKEMNSGSGYQLVQGYRRIEVKSFRLERPNLSLLPSPHGRTATVSGLVIYSQHESGQFVATLEEEEQDWKLLAIDISPTPDSAS